MDSSLSLTSDIRGARELAEESKSALVDLEIFLKRRNEVLKQQIREKHRETITFSEEKENIQHKLQDERCAFANKREQLWNETEQGEMALERTNEVVQELEQRLSVQARESAALQQQLHALIEKDTEARAKHAQLQQEVERLQEQLKEQSEAFELERARWTEQ